MKKTIYLILITVLLNSCQYETDVPHAPDEDQSTSPAAKKHELGKTLFRANCAVCHHQTKNSAGPALQGALGRAPDKEWVYKFVRNSAKLIAEGDKYANELYKTYGKTAMTAFPTLSNEDIDAIMAYCDEPPGY